MATAQAKVDEAKLGEFMGKAVGDLGAGISLALAYIGDKLGLYKAMAEAGPVTPAELAKKSGTHERYIREWLNNQAASGYVAYDAASGRYHLPAEQAMALADEGSPVFLPGAFQVLVAAFSAMPRAIENFRSGQGMPWGDHCADLFAGTERFFRPNYRGHLIGEWIPALDGVQEKLQKGAKVADVGCGLGASTILMAQAFPKSTFVGFDYHPGSIETARERAAAAGVSDRVSFEVAMSTDYAGHDYDLVAHFDCLHDMGDPQQAARHVRQSLKTDGTWMIVEPYANDHAEDNHNPVGRVFYGFSTLLCVPHSLAYDGPALGAQAGEGRMRDLATTAGFTRFRRAAETPFNLVLEARP